MGSAHAARLRARDPLHRVQGHHACAAHPRGHREAGEEAAVRVVHGVPLLVQPGDLG